jgi:predicted RNA-binding Zn-ribbon protein involved in translation (DUF1610 family)
MGGLFTIGLAATLHEGSFRCPHCGNYFKRAAARDRPWLNAARCAQCGIPIGTPKSAAPSPVLASVDRGA